MIDIRDIAHALARIGRYNGHTTEFYSVAQHCILVSRQLPKEEALHGLLHDAAEAYLGDVTAPLKRQLPKYMEIEKRMETVIGEKYGIPASKSEAVHEADMRMLMTEARDLMGIDKNPEYWDIDAKPYEETVEVWDSQTAENLYLAIFLHHIAERGDI
jgi:5'-deoxynucleotidase YfbR-like HD superfamily hydrolase